jgi:hypothetical protein
MLAEATTFAPAIAMKSSSSAVAVLRSNTGGELRFSTYNLGVWTAFQPVAAFVTTRATPQAAVYNGEVNVLFHGDNYKHYRAAYQAAWSPTAEPVGGAATQSFGPSPAAVAGLPAELLAVYAGDNGDIYTQSYTTDWQAAVPFNLGNTVGLSPAVIPQKGAADAMMVYVRKADAKIYWTARSVNGWYPPVEIPEALTADAPALAPLPNGAAVLAFRGTDSKIYTAIYTPGAPTPWTLPSELGGFSTPSTPALAPGLAPAQAELAFIDTATGAAKHARLINMAWSAPVTVGGVAKTTVAIATSP